MTSARHHWGGRTTTHIRINVSSLSVQATSHSHPPDSMASRRAMSGTLAPFMFVSVPRLAAHYTAHRACVIGAYSFARLVRGSRTITEYLDMSILGYVPQTSLGFNTPLICSVLPQSPLDTTSSKPVSLLRGHLALSIPCNMVSHSFVPWSCGAINVRVGFGVSWNKSANDSLKPTIVGSRNLRRRRQVNSMQCIHEQARIAIVGQSSRHRIVFVEYRNGD